MHLGLSEETQADPDLLRHQVPFLESNGELATLALHHVRSPRIPHLRD